MNYDPLNPPQNTDRWFEADEGQNINWTQASRFKDGYTRQDLVDLKTYYPYLESIISRLDEKNYDWNNKLSPQDLMDLINRDTRWVKTNNYLKQSLNNRAAYIARRRDLDPNDDDTSFMDKWKNYGNFEMGEDGKWKYTVTSGKEKDFDEAFWKSRNDGLLGAMYDVMVPAETASQNYELDENGNPTGKILLSTDGYTKVGDPYSFYTKNNKDPYAPYINNQITYWKKSKTSTNGAAGNEDTSNYPIVGYKPQTYWTDYTLGMLPGLTGLALQLSQGKPDTSGLDAAAAFADRYAGIMAPPHLTHGLMKPAIIDPRVGNNTDNARRLGVNRMLRNTGSAPSQGATILANDMNYQTQMG